ncbi:hypothetical protein NHX12_015152 [Muraenolepis orangiensis]|uniref:Dipeptidyl peptidase 4 n=1 Tax=Muraenolepis orangiensis TaxID=630683 RepID=A0A9Q0DDG8_9TELE|nr:hypothetical protein NHX12_015152 [Muraenolepis orangiensis]
MSAHNEYAAFRSNYTKQWRHSFNASYTIYNLAFVWENDMYVKQSPSSPAARVTSDGEHNRILNGIPDWVYEEEMFSSNRALWWSPGGKRLAYAKFNDTGVHTIEYSWFGEDQYPTTVVIPYPKAGTPNPVVTLFVVDAENVTRVMPVAIPSSFNTGDHYLATVTWVTDERLAVQWLKRKQEHLLLQIYNFDGTSWTAGESLPLDQVNGWIGRFSPAEPVFATDMSAYLVMSDGKGYKHLHSVVAGKVHPLTSGPWEVVDILKVTDGGIVHNSSYYRMGCHGPGVPRFYLRNNVDGTEVNVLEDNSQFVELISDIQMPTTRHGTIKLRDFDIKYQLTLPPGFQESKKYPLLVDVYAGPGSQKANHRYSVGWSSYLASTENIIVASFDGRGSGFRGDKLMHAIYRRLGTYEVEDQITAVREIMKERFIDKERIAIWGWSYGGYVTSMALGAGSGLFKCGMAVAPVSKWEYYDSIYTERYMNEPLENADFYGSSTVTARAANFSSVQYLLVHGTADDNVHFQQAAQISKALVEKEIDFEAMWYTDEDHGLGEHVYSHISHFLLRCFA